MSFTRKFTIALLAIIGAIAVFAAGFVGTLAYLMFSEGVL